MHLKQLKISVQYLEKNKSDCTIVLSQPASAFSETSLLESAMSAIYYSLFTSEPSIQIKLSAMMMKESL